jgi:hypothetical protein
MTLPRTIILLVWIAGCYSVCPAEEQQKKEETIKLQPFTHTAYWQDFALSKDSPLSDDGRYRLKEVRKNGEVELYLVQERDNATVVVKPKPKKLEKGKPVPLIVVLEADTVKQSAIISEMRFR